MLTDRVWPPSLARANQCWVSSFTNKLTSKVKLVGLGYNCARGLNDIEWLDFHAPGPGLAKGFGLRRERALSRRFPVELGELT